VDSGVSTNSERKFPPKLRTEEEEVQGTGDEKKETGEKNEREEGAVSSQYKTSDHPDSWGEGRSSFLESD